MQAQITYLDHSGFSVKTAAHFLVFDYYLDTPHGGGLAQGVINPDLLGNENAAVFVSHHHPDHFSPRIFGWKSSVPKIRYFLADDIRTHEDAVFFHPGQSEDFGDMTVRALKSTDAGVAFLIHTDGLCIYHAGDLNWWKWDEDTEPEQKEAGQNFRAQIDLLKGEKVDLAFLPVDPRQGGDALLGFDYFMRTVQPEHAVPMHSFGRTEFFSRLLTEACTEPYRSRILLYQNRGDQLSI